MYTALTCTIGRYHHQLHPTLETLFAYTKINDFSAIRTRRMKNQSQPTSIRQPFFALTFLGSNPVGQH